MVQPVPAPTTMQNDLKAITCHVQITGVRAKVDGSLGISLSTPELSPENKAVFMSWMNRDLEMLLQTDASAGAVQHISGRVGTQTPSQRLRAAIFKLWQTSGGSESFDGFYVAQMERLIATIDGQTAVET